MSTGASAIRTSSSIIEVGGLIIAVVRSVYAMVLGFLTVVVWQHFATAREPVVLESAAATEPAHRVRLAYV